MVPPTVLKLVGNTTVQHLQTKAGGHYLQRDAAARIAADFAEVARRHQA